MGMHRSQLHLYNQLGMDLVKLYLLIQEFRPDLYVELGRGGGASLTTAALGMCAAGSGRIVSIDIKPVDEIGHDILERFEVASGIPMVHLTRDIRSLTLEEWDTLITGRRRVVVFVDAHEETGKPVTEKLIPLSVKSSSAIIFLFHDVLLVEDEYLFDRFDESYAKMAPYISPYPEYQEIFPNLERLESGSLGHFADPYFHHWDPEYQAWFERAGLKQFMYADPAVQKWKEGVTIKEIQDSWSRLRPSGIMVYMNV